MKSHAGPIEKVLAEAKAANRIVMIDFFSDNPACKFMKTKVYTDPAVAAFADANLVFFAVDAEKGDGVGLAKKYEVIMPHPQFVFLGPDGAEIDRVLGPRSKEDFLGALKDVKAGNTFAAYKARLDKDPADAEAHAVYGRKLLERERAEDGAEHLRKAVELDPKDGKPSTIEARLHLSFLQANADQSLLPIQEFAEKYAASPQAVTAHRVLAQNLERIGDTDGALKSLEFLHRKGALDPTGRNQYAWTLAINDRDLEKALGLIDAALKEMPDEAAFLDTRAECLSRLGRHDEAVAAQKKAVEKVKDDSEKAQYRERLDAFEKARAAAKAKKAAEGAGGDGAK